MQVQVFGISKKINTNVHSFMSFVWIMSICPEQTIPPRNVETIIAVRFLWNNRMMNPMHVWSYYKTS